MFGLGKHGPDGRYAVIVDVGSGSVGMAIVASDPYEARPHVVWSHREWTTIQDLEKIDDAAKDVTTAIINGFLELGSRGLTTLRTYDAKAKIQLIQASICAPWSYTIAKSVSSNSEKPFKVNKSLITELISTAQDEALAVIDTNDFLQQMGLEVISDATINISTNGYLTRNPIGQTVESVTVTQLTGVTEQKLLAAIKEASEKILKSAKLETTTFMYQYYLALRDLLQDTTEVCLFDITSEATEIGIIRDGVLKYVTHMPYGSRSIAREISNLCGITKEEALGYLRSNDVDQSANLSTDKQAELKVIVEAFENKLADLMSRTGDALAIPKTVYMHTDVLTEAFFKTTIERAGLKANRVEHSVHPITSKLFPETTNEDTGLLLSSYVFHKKLPGDALLH